MNRPTHPLRKFPVRALRQNGHSLIPRAQFDKTPRVSSYISPNPNVREKNRNGGRTLCTPESTQHMEKLSQIFDLKCKIVENRIFLQIPCGRGKSSVAAKMVQNLSRSFFSVG